MSRVNLPLRSTLKYNGRTVKLVRGGAAQYADGEIACGFATGMGEDDFFIRLMRQDWDVPTFWFARRDELEAFMSVIASTLYLDSIVRKNANRHHRGRRSRARSHR